MELNEMIALMAAPIYANWALQYQFDATESGKSMVTPPELNTLAMQTACKAAHALWHHAMKEAKSE
jgi:hypothetical protein